MEIIQAMIGKRIISIKDCRGFSSIRGLMFDSMQDYDGALIYANAIWMPFVKHNLDLIFLDKSHKILEIQAAIPITANPKTWRIYRQDDAKYCLEIKSGIISNLKTLTGKKVKLGS